MRMGMTKGLVAGGLIGMAAATVALMSMPESAALRRTMKRRANSALDQAMQQWKF